VGVERRRDVEHPSTSGTAVSRYAAYARPRRTALLLIDPVLSA